MLRRESLYSSHLATWRKERNAAVRAGLAPKPRGPKPKTDPLLLEIDKLREENQRLADSLRKAELIIEVQEQVAALLGWTPAAGDKC